MQVGHELNFFGRFFGIVTINQPLDTVDQVVVPELLLRYEELIDPLDRYISGRGLSTLYYFMILLGSFDNLSDSCRQVDDLFGQVDFCTLLCNNLFYDSFREFLQGLGSCTACDSTGLT